jgi:hypothetical protein
MGMFMDLVREHRRGLTHDDLTEQLREVIAGVAVERRTGSLSVNFTFSPRAKGEGVDVTVAINAKPPKPEAASSVFFITPNNELVREDPRQENLGLRDIGPTQAFKGVG